MKKTRIKSSVHVKKKHNALAQVLFFQPKCL